MPPSLNAMRIGELILKTRYLWKLESHKRLRVSYFLSFAFIAFTISFHSSQHETMRRLFPFMVLAGIIYQQRTFAIFNRLQPSKKHFSRFYTGLIIQVICSIYVFYLSFSGTII